MKRDERRMYKVLFSVVKEYIKRKKPVSSKRILEVTNLSWSGATVRNDLRRLEELGYVYQPHTSAGRIPTDKGLRFYVDEIKKLRSQWTSEDLGLESYYHEFPVGDIESILEALAKVISKAASGVVLIRKPSIGSLKLIKAHVVPVGEDHAVVDLITELGLSRIVPIARVRNVDLEALGKLFELFCGRTFDEIAAGLERFKPENEEQKFLLNIAKGILRFVMSGERIVYKGVYELIKSSAHNLIELLEVLETPEKLEPIFTEVHSLPVRVYIGSENPIKELAGFSAFVAPYFRDRELIGHMAVITDRFVEYERIFSLLEFISNRLTEYLTLVSRR